MVIVRYTLRTEATPFCFKLSVISDKKGTEDRRPMTEEVQHQRFWIIEQRLVSAKARFGWTGIKP